MNVESSKVNMLWHGLVTRDLGGRAYEGRGAGRGGLAVHDQIL